MDTKPRAGKTADAARNADQFGDVAVVYKQILIWARRFASGTRNAMTAEDLAQDCMEHLMIYSPDQILVPSWGILHRVATQCFVQTLLRERRAKQYALQGGVNLEAFDALNQHTAHRGVEIRIHVRELAQVSDDPVVLDLLNLVLHPDAYWEWSARTLGSPRYPNRRLLKSYLHVSYGRLGKAVEWLRRNAAFLLGG